jgi:hypothetical protein
MAYDYIPGTRVEKTDQNLLPTPSTPAKKILVVGTAEKGRADVAYPVVTSALAKAEFGTGGTLIRGMYEAQQSGATDVILYRIGGTPAKVVGIGDSTGAGGYIVETIQKDSDAGTDFALYYGDATNRLVVIRTSDELVVYDNDSTTPIDRGFVLVSGARASAGGDDIGSPSGFVNLADVSATGTVYTAGDDGVDLSRMKIYEKLYVAYKDLLTSNFDVLVPMDVYFDDYNVVPQGAYIGAVTPVAASANTYPTAGSYLLGSDVDSLGRVYVEEYEGEYYFWWIFDNAGTFTAADIYPTGVGSASATAKIDGTDLAIADFHEVNFGYQLSRFLYDYSTDIVDATGVIGVLPPASASVVDKARWLGKSPTWTLNVNTGEYTIANSNDNGTGLLGNKFMVGRSDHRSGVFGGGMILTDSEFMDGTELLDANDVPVDLGKYLSVVADTVFLRNSWYPAGYLSTFAASYGGMYLNMPTIQAPTNKTVSKTINMKYPFKLGDTNLLASVGYVVLRNKPKGLVVNSSPMATLPNSDWKKLSTVRIVKDVIDGVRSVADPYIGNALSAGGIASLKEAIQKVLQNAVGGGALKRYDPFEILQTPDMAVAGEAAVELTLVPAFELVKLTLTISLAKS